MPEDSSTYVMPQHVATIIRDCIEVRLPSPENFLKVKETLTRIGIASRKEKILYQSCHVLHKQGKYYIVHFKELFLLDGKASRTNFEEVDRARRNTIANLLSEWGLVELVEPSRSASPVSLPNQVTILPFSEKLDWTLVAKYEIGKRKAG
jgi:hypothetical protein